MIANTVTTANALAHPNLVPKTYPHAVAYRYGDGHLEEVDTARHRGSVIRTGIRGGSIPLK